MLPQKNITRIQYCTNEIYRTLQSATLHVVRPRATPVARHFTLQSSKILLLMSYMLKVLLPLLAVPVLVLTACTARGVVKNAKPVQQEEKTEQTALERELRERMQQQAETFTTLNEKMDEYQDLQVICDRIAGTPEEVELKAVCERALKARRRELLDLSDRLEEQQR